APIPCCPLSLNATPTTEIYPLSLHDALPIWLRWRRGVVSGRKAAGMARVPSADRPGKVRLPGADQAEPGAPHPHGALDWERRRRSEEHTSELQSLTNLVCRLLLEKKKKTYTS